MSDSDLALVHSRRLEIARLRGQLDAEDAELEIAERVLGRLQAAKRPTGGGLERKVPSGRRPNGQLTQRDMILGTLRALPHPWVKDTATLQARIKEFHGIEIPMTSLQPYLSDLKKDKFIVRDEGGGIALSERARQEPDRMREAAE